MNGSRNNNRNGVPIEEEEGEKRLYTEDGTVDLRGKPVLRSNTGRWKACSFIVVYEVFERMAYFGISSNLFIYLTTKLRQGTVRSANNVTNWLGTNWITPILGAYVGDALLGRYWTFLIATAIYFSGMSLLTLSVSIHPLKPSSCPDPNGVHCQKPTTLQIVVFFVALYIIALGNGGTKPNISTIGADQFDEFDPKEKIQKLSFFNWWAFSILFGALFATTVLIYIQDNVGWALGYGIPTIGLAISILIFLAGTPFYRHKVPMGSSLTTIIKVIVASISKWKVEIPTDAKELYELDPIEYGEGKHMIDSTNSMRFLNKACVRTSSSKPWLLSSVTQVEETKQILRMIPILIVTFIPSTMVAQIGTLFIKQGTTLNRHIGAFKIPPASLGLFVTISMLVSLVVYDRVFVKIIRKRTRNPRGITLLQRMGIGMILHIIIMVIASLTERYRIHVARKNGLVENGGQVPLSVFIILPQFILMGVADAFLEVAKLEFFYDQAPESMKSLGASYSLTSLGAGNFISSLFLTIVSNVTSGNGHEGWIRNNLNASHLDYYYAFFAILNCINFVLFLVVVRFYVYRAEVSDSMKVLAEELTVRKTEGGQ
ncbi:protein NRT1/ PTR FAMILY 5.2-like isoform X1 [Andrographis paniculata]|uniref:protein NRT1/ PTR FAMILY 5.2-like isoform X1 n=1 Tax=Andrographis paniculata TaxID=175694 RepID=UPI0021E882F0|nr:protein NRT1/ PTR FAMILY 5.2-like isoform X1 [Andrographis paniculata]